MGEYGKFADIGAGGPGFLSFEAFHSFCGFQSLCFTEHDICISRVYSNEAVPGGIRSIVQQMEVFSLFVRSRKKYQGHCFERNG